MQLNRLVSQQEITARIDEIAKQILAVFSKNKPIIAICMLRGGVPFYADIVKRLTDKQVIFEFVSAGSYVKSADGKMQSGELSIKFSSFDTAMIKGADVLIIDDVMDTGLTLSQYINMLNTSGASMVKTAVLIDKPFAHKVDIKPDFVGFTIEGNPYLVGYGMDCNQQYRNLDGVYEII